MTIDFLTQMGFNPKTTLHQVEKHTSKVDIFSPPDNYRLEPITIKVISDKIEKIKAPLKLKNDERGNLKENWLHVW